MDFVRYLETVERAQLNTFLQSSAGRAQLAKTGDSILHYANDFAFFMKGAPKVNEKHGTLMLVTAAAKTPNELSSV